MAQIPVYRSQQVSPRPVSVPQFQGGSPDQFGAAIGGALAQAGAVVGAVAAEERQRTDRARVVEQVGSLSEFETGLLTQQRELTGAAAVNSAKTFGEQWQTEVARRANLLQQGVQRDAFLADAQQRSEHVLNSLKSHESEQVLAYRRNTGISTADAAALSAAVNFSDPALVGQAVTDARNALAPLGHVATLKGLSALHSGVLARYADVNPATAREYLDAHRNELTAEDFTHWQHVLSAASMEAQAREREYSIAAAHPGDFAAQVEAARSIADQTLSDATLRRLDARRVSDDTAKVEAHRAVLDTARNAFKATYSPDSIPRATWGVLTPEEQTSFYRLQRERLDNAQGKAMRVEDIEPAALRDWVTYKSLPPEQRASVDVLTRFGGRVPIAMVLRETEEQQAVRDAIGKGDPSGKLSSLKSFAEQLKTSAVKAGLLTYDGKPTEDAATWKRYTALEDRVQRDVNQLERAQGRPATADERQAVIDRSLIELSRTSSWFRFGADEVKYAFEAPSAPVFDLAAERTKARAALTRQRARLRDARPVTDADVDGLLRQAGVIR